MGIVERARNDWARLSQKVFDGDIIFTAPTTETVTIKGIASRRNVVIETDGQVINGQLAHVSVHESLLAGYPARNTRNEIAMEGHRLSFADSNGTVREYIIKEVAPDNTVGMLVFILQDFE